MATGTTTLDFGAAPGSDYTFTDVTGQSGLSAASYVEAFEMYENGGNRQPDESLIDPADFRVEYLTATSFRIHGQVRDGEIIGTITVRWASVP